LNLDNEESEIQKQKIWDSISNKESITLYRQGGENKASKVLTLTRKQVDFIVN